VHLELLVLKETGEILVPMDLLVLVVEMEMLDLKDA